MIVDLITNIASELLMLSKITEFLTGLAVILSYENNLFLKKKRDYYLLERNNIVIYLRLS